MQNKIKCLYNQLLYEHILSLSFDHLLFVAGYAESCVNEGEIVNVLTIKNMMCYTCMCKVSTTTVL